MERGRAGSVGLVFRGSSAGWGSQMEEKNKPAAAGKCRRGGLPVRKKTEGGSP